MKNVNKQAKQTPAKTPSAEEVRALKQQADQLQQDLFAQYGLPSTASLAELRTAIELKAEQAKQARAQDEANLAAVAAQVQPNQKK